MIYVLIITPFLVSSLNEQSPFELIKLISIGLAALIGSIWFLTQPVFRWNKSLNIILLINIVTILSFCFSNNKYISLYGNFNIPTNSVVTTFILSSFAFLAFQKFNELHFRRIIYFTSVALGAYGIVQHFGLDPFTWWNYSKSQMSLNAYATFGQAVSYATVMLCALPLILHHKKIIFSFFVMMGLMYSGSRMPTVLAVLTFLFYAYKHKSKSILIILALTQIIYYSESNALTDKFKPEQVNSGLSERVAVWRDAVKIWTKYPILGAGPENFANELKLVNGPEFNQYGNYNLLWNKAHNDFFHYLATIGILGLLTHLLLAYRAFRLKTPYAIGAILILIANLTAFNFTLTQLYLLLFVTISDEIHIYRLNKIKWVFALLVLAASFLLYKSWRSDYFYTKSRKYLDLSSYQSASQFIDMAIYENPYDCKNYLRKANYIYLASKESPVFIPELKKQLDLGLECDPRSPEAFLFAGQVFSDLFATKKHPYTYEAENYLSKGQELAPNQPVYPYNLAILYFNDNQQAKALRLIDRVLELKSDHSGALRIKTPSQGNP